MSSQPCHTDQHETLFDQLQSLLEKQETMIKKSEFRSVELLSEQAAPLIAEIIKRRLPRQSRWEDRCKQLIKQYNKIELMIEVEKDAIHKQLRKIGTGKKTIQVYR